MLKKILAITGKPGLFKIISHSGKTLIVEDLATGKKFPVSPRDRVVSLGDIAIYTETEDRPLGEVLEAIYKKEDGKNIDLKEIIKEPGLKLKFEEYLPDFDKERVHDSDVKKLFSWYNILVQNGITDFKEEDKEPEESKEAETEKESAKEDSKK